MPQGFLCSLGTVEPDSIKRFNQCSEQKILSSFFNHPLKWYSDHWRNNLPDRVSGESIFLLFDSNTGNIKTNLRAQQQIALFSIHEDDGGVATENWLCTLIFDDDRYLPFEGTGAISTWSLKFPDKQVIDQVLKNINGGWKLKDILIHLHYTARDGGNQFSKQVADKLAEEKNGSQT